MPARVMRHDLLRSGDLPRPSCGAPIRRGLVGMITKIVKGQFASRKTFRQPTPVEEGERSAFIPARAMERSWRKNMRRLWAIC